MEQSMKANDSHLVYMTRGGDRAMITQSFGRVIGEDEATVTIDRPSLLTGRPIVVPRTDLYGRADGRRLTEAEMQDILTAHRHEQRI
jgi:hypothetical protein